MILEFDFINLIIIRHIKIYFLHESRIEHEKVLKKFKNKNAKQLFFCINMERCVTKNDKKKTIYKHSNNLQN